MLFHVPGLKKTGTSSINLCLIDMYKRSKFKWRLALTDPLDFDRIDLCTLNNR